MAQFNADILLQVQTSGEQRLNKIKASVEQLNRLSQNLKPLNLLAPGGGNLGNSLRQAFKPLKDFARDATNGTAQFSNTLAGATSQAQTFETVLKNVKLSAGGYSGQVAEVKNFANALAQAEEQAAELNVRLQQIQRTARQAAGAPIGPATRLGSDEEQSARVQYALEQQITNEQRQQQILSQRAIRIEEELNARLRRRRQEQERIADQQQRSQRLRENLLLGAGFPLLFGGGIGSVLGGVGGALADSGGQGFGAQIFASAIGQIIDQFVAKTGELGRALNPLTADVDKIIQASGAAGTKTAAYVEQLKAADRESEALAVATAELAFVVGREGVDALREFGSQTQQLTNDWNVLMTQVGAALAQLLSGPVASLLKAVETTSAINIARGSQDPALKALTSKLDKSSAPFLIGGQALGGEDRLAIEEQIVKRVTELRAEREKELAAAENVSAVRRVDINVLEAELALAQTNGDITDKTVYALERKLILQQTNVKLQDALVKGLETETILLEEQVKLKQLDQKRQQALDRAAASAQDAYLKTQQGIYNLQSKIAKESLEQAQLSRDLTEFEKGSLAASEEELKNFEQVSLLKIRILDYEQARALAAKDLSDTERDLLQSIYNKQLNNLQLQYDLDKKRIQAAIQLKKIEEQQFKAELKSEMIRQENAAAQAMQASSTSNEFVAFFGGSAQLAQAQTLSYASGLAELNDELERNKQVLDSADFAKLSADTQLQYTRENEQIRNRIALYKEYQPAINAAALEQQKFRDALALTQPAVAVVSQLFRDFTDETVTGTEAIAKALRGFADILIQEVQRIIAAYIALGVAKTFAGVGGAGGGGTGDSVSSFNAAALQYRASGGPVTSGSPYIVGEKGPELFVPGRSGAIVPNDALGGGGTTVNITLNGVGGGSTTSAGTNKEEAAQLARMVEGAVTGILIRERRPGGLLAR